MNHLFAALPREKQEKILTACVQEFAEKGFQESSTNRMIEKAGIAKGSLFKYFGSKEELYIYVLDQAAAELLAEYTAQAVNLSRDLVSRIIQLAEIEMRIHLRRAKQFRLFKQALVEDGSKLSQKSLWCPGREAGPLALGGCGCHGIGLGSASGSAGSQLAFAGVQ